jgi:NAD(P)-dependent dehydrogenase (short-subunit alcohol dehydrogenase family)
MAPQGKVAIVTSRGIGRQIALELAVRGMSVVVAARTVEALRKLPVIIGHRGRSADLSRLGGVPLSKFLRHSTTKSRS